MSVVPSAMRARASRGASRTAVFELRDALGQPAHRAIRDAERAVRLGRCGKRRGRSLELVDGLCASTIPQRRDSGEHARRSARRVRHQRDPARRRREIARAPHGTGRRPSRRIRPRRRRARRSAWLPSRSSTSANCGERRRAWQAAAFGRRHERGHERFHLVPAALVCQMRCRQICRDRVSRVERVCRVECGAGGPGMSGRLVHQTLEHEERCALRLGRRSPVASRRSPRPAAAGPRRGERGPPASCRPAP